MNTDKITPQHKERHAIIYVRQSSLTQVLHHLESQRRQYGLKQHALSLGFRSAQVIDEDLGRSGSGLVERPGFARLLEQVCSGEVGAVLALEASRLARNNRDWHHLVDLCAMTDTLVIDYDGVYDARLLNDRLLLGLKGTMSEFELGLLRQRAQEALRQKIARGEVLHIAPAGYIRTEDNRMEMTPDLQVQQAIRDMFARFRECGSARQVLLSYRQESARLPTLDAKGRVIWEVPVFGRIIGFLKNPTYAGVYGYGRTMSRTIIENGRQRRTSGHDREQKDWMVMIRDHHAGYITWEQYQENQRLLQENANMSGKMRTAVRRGTALLSGLLRCGHCGRPMRTYYTGNKRRTPRYICCGAMINHGAPACISVGALRVDEVVSAAVLGALQPLGIEASFEAERLQAEQLRRRQDALRLALEKARYEADRCRRQFEAVEPENRLVAAELERRWNVALAEVARLDEALQNQQQVDGEIAGAEASRLRALGSDVTVAWEHPAAPIELKKRILRTVLEEVIVRIDPAPERVKPIAPLDLTLPPPVESAKPMLSAESQTVILTVHWAGGVHTTLQLLRPSRKNHPLATPKDTIQLLRKLVMNCGDDRIAQILNLGGHRTGKGLPWKANSVAHARQKHGIPCYIAAEGRKWLTLTEAAEKLEMSANTVKKMIAASVLPAQQAVAHAPWAIAPESLNLPKVIEIADTLKKTGLLILPNDCPANLELSLS
jgi:DNA invertase Pin-like site-specific DNA recombinase